MAPGFFLDVDDPDEGKQASLTHACRSLRQFAISVDGIEEALAGLADAAREENEVMFAAKAKVPDGEGFPLPGDFGAATRYWRERQLGYAKAGVIALDQIREALVYLDGAMPHPALRQAVADLTTNFPDLIGLRDSVAHASVRARWAKRGPRGTEITLALTPEETKNGVYYTDFLSSVGLVDGVNLSLRVDRGGAPATATLAFTEETIAVAAGILQTLVLALPWRTDIPGQSTIFWPFG